MPTAGNAEPISPPNLSREEHLSILAHMVFCRILDDKMLGLQRQGRIGFYGPMGGQEAATVGAGFALEDSDWFYPALRDGAVLLMRGYPLEHYIAQMIGNEMDPALGRQMPCHFSSAGHNFVSLSSVIGTQIPQAVGTAIAAKVRGEKIAVMGCMGDGATSSTDFHSALIMAKSQNAPVVLYCQNNGWAISVPFSAQTASQDVAIKAKAYGIDGVQVDGNDVLAVIAVTRDALEQARAGKGPTLIEAVTYRCGGHSSSDDPTRYRDEKDTPSWLLEDPITRYNSWLTDAFDLQEEEIADIEEKARSRIEAAIKLAESADMPLPETLFQDVYSELTPELTRQQRASLGGDTGGVAAGEFPL
jgi:pyruvate dehydrogenase E1 component alpha subunit/2-oxoisovalerate dehydrogenase E1 component alpha subunit